MSEYPNPIFVGYTAQVLPNWKDHLKEPVVPKSHQADDKKAAWLESYYAVLEQNAPFFKLTGELASICAVDVMSKDIFNSSRAADQELASAFVSWLQKKYDFSEYGRREDKQRNVCFYGFNPKPLLRLAGVGALREGYGDVPVSLWYGNEECLDPKEMLLETDMKKLTGLQKVLAEAPGGPIEVPPAYFQPGFPWPDRALTDTVLAAQICLRYQLIPASQANPLESLNLQYQLPEAEVEGEEPENGEEVEDEQETKEPKQKKRKT